MKQATGGKYVVRRADIGYVSEIPGDGGVDWGYTQEVAKALRLNEYFKRRFVADCHRVGKPAIVAEMSK